MTVPDNLLIQFFNEATLALNEYSVPDDAQDITPPPLSEQRQRLLGVQKSCLQRVLSEYFREHDVELSMEEVQNKLRGMSGTDDRKLKESMDRMNDSARLAFCRGVLEAECIWEAQNDKGERPPGKSSDDGPLERSAILEFCGLCNAVVRLENVQVYLSDGSSSPPLSDDNLGIQTSEIGSPSTMSQIRLQRIQELLVRAVGYDPAYATAEIRSIFVDHDAQENTHRHFVNDVELHETVSQCISNMSVAAMNASLQRPFENLSDLGRGGVTRVVSVQYSERIVDGSGSISTGAPSTESIQEQVDEQKQRDLWLARQAAVLQQGILEELLVMTEQDREANLQAARDAHDSFLKGALETSPGPERVSHLRSVDPNTQRLLVMHKLWTNMMAENSGVSPQARPTE